MKLKHFLLCLFLAYQATAVIITEYANACSACIDSGYNYCLTDNTCRDNRPTACTTILDRNVDCPLTYVTCRSILINNTDTGSTKKIEYYLTFGKACIVNITYAMNKGQAAGYFIVQNTDPINNNVRFNITNTELPNMFYQLNPLTLGQRYSVTPTQKYQYILAYNYGSSAAANQYFQILFSKADMLKVIGALMGMGLVTLSLVS